MDLLQDRGRVPQNPSGKTAVKKSQSPDLSVDSPLEAGIDRYIKSNRFRRRLASTDRTSFVVYDISKGKKVVSINEDQPMMAASLIKNFVMLVYFHEVRQGRLHHTNQNRRQLKNMIQRSYNTSTNYFIRLLGGPDRVNQLLKWNYPYFEHTRIVEYIPNGGRTYRNMTSAHDMNRFYNQLWLGRLPHSPKMKHYLRLPKGDRLYDKTCIPRGVHVYNKPARFMAWWETVDSGHHRPERQAARVYTDRHHRGQDQNQSAESLPILRIMGESPHRNPA